MGFRHRPTDAPTLRHARRVPPLRPGESLIVDLHLILSSDDEAHVLLLPARRKGVVYTHLRAPSRHGPPAPRLRDDVRRERRSRDDPPHPGARALARRRRALPRFLGVPSLLRSSLRAVPGGRPEGA